MFRRIPPLSPTLLTLLVSMALVLLYNGQFWSALLDAVPARSARDLLFIASFGVLLVVIFNLLLQALPARRLLKPVLVLLLLVAAGVSHFASAYGTIIDRHMVASLLQTDAREARDLLGLPMLARLLLLGLLPSILVWRLPLARRSWRRATAVRGGVVASSVTLLALLLWPSYQDYAFFLREHRELGQMVNPATALIAAVKFSMDEPLAAGPVQRVAGNVTRLASTQRDERPTVVVLVLGETARAASFSLNGYAQPTNPELSRLPVVSFENVSSCGTSTAESLPCMFSHLGRAEYSERTARTAENLLDILQRAGLEVAWIDNNAGCKGVCERVPTERTSHGTDPALCPDGECRDEVMLEPLQRIVRDAQTDTVVVLHMNGSHGPAYFKRYPDDFRKFTPTCETSEIRSCSTEAIRNTYDNTIVYTDHFLARVVATLEAASERLDTAMLYVSDHGESLGEASTWLHGLPYHIAPDVQKHVPMILWASGGYSVRQGLDLDCLQAASEAPLSHDHLFHSMLGLLDVRTDIYAAGLDFATQCRGKAGDHGVRQAARESGRRTTAQAGG